MKAREKVREKRERKRGREGEKERHAEIGKIPIISSTSYLYT